ncbi:MAG: HNH endonuclease [Gordonia sp. (in: high G+C Gram-positive bacteria)]|uniref:HNH endonuclease n=1 Tax=Gordonia sp. (in: high G+C Gram-positive bacteria) TaxID=84139 RepID=UPI0039E387EF
MFTRKPVIAVDFGHGWSYAYKVDEDGLVDSRVRFPKQPRKYNRVRNGETTNRGNLGPVPPREELEITPRPLDETAPSEPSTDLDTDEAGAELVSAIALGGEIERRYAERVVWQRLHQPELRRMTLDHHGTACAYCGMDVPQIVEAAHLVADSEGGAASTENTRPMCPNHHRAFDAGLLVWDGNRFEPADGAPSVGPAPDWA